MDEKRQKCIVVWGVVGGSWKEHGAVVLKAGNRKWRESLNEARALFENDNEYLFSLLADVEIGPVKNGEPMLFLVLRSGREKQCRLIGFPLKETLSPILEEYGCEFVRTDFDIPDWGDKTHQHKGDKIPVTEFPDKLERHLLDEGYAQSKHTVFHLCREDDDPMCVVTTYMVKELKEIK